MPRQEQRNVSVSSHSDTEWDINVSVPVAFGWHRYSVLVPKTLDRREFLAAAVDLAIYVRSRHAAVAVFVPGALYQQASRTLRYERLHAEADRLDNEMRAAGRGVHPPPGPDWHSRPEPTATEKARALLRQIDPELCSKMELGKAFFFTTLNHRYMIYPTQRAMIDLSQDEPKYICVHSRDHAVETNMFDWILTMRTYLLGNEAHLRKTANFHSEYSMRAPADAYRTDYLDAPTTDGEGGPAGPRRT